jgi:hypothetical protein
LELFFGAVVFMCMGTDEQSDAIKCKITKTVEAFSCVEQYTIVSQLRRYSSRLIWLISSNATAAGWHIVTDGDQYNIKHCDVSSASSWISYMKCDRHCMLTMFCCGLLLSHSINVLLWATAVTFH